MELCASASFLPPTFCASARYHPPTPLLVKKCLKLHKDAGSLPPDCYEVECLVASRHGFKVQYV